MDLNKENLKIIYEQINEKHRKRERQHFLMDWENSVVKLSVFPMAIYRLNGNLC